MRPDHFRLLALVLPAPAAAILLQTPHPALAVYGAVQLRGASEAAGDAGFYASPGRTLGLILESGNDSSATTATRIIPDVYGKLTLRSAGPRHRLCVMPLNLQSRPPPNATTGDGGGGFAIDSDGRFFHRARNPGGLWDACGRPGDYRLAVAAAADDGLDDCIRNISLIALG